MKASEVRISCGQTTFRYLRACGLPAAMSFKTSVASCNGPDFGSRSTVLAMVRVRLFSCGSRESVVVASGFKDLWYTRLS